MSQVWPGAAGFLQSSTIGLWNRGLGWLGRGTELPATPSPAPATGTSQTWAQGPPSTHTQVCGRQRRGAPSPPLSTQTCLSRHLQPGSPLRVPGPQFLRTASHPWHVRTLSKKNKQIQNKLSSILGERLVCTDVTLNQTLLFNK